MLEVTWFGVERSKVKVTRPITLHNDTLFYTTTALYPRSPGSDTSTVLLWLQPRFIVIR